MDFSFQVECHAGTLWVNRRDEGYFVDYLDREWELITEEKYAEIGDPDKHVTYELMGIKRSDCSDAFNRWCDMFRRPPRRPQRPLIRLV